MFHGNSVAIPAQFETKIMAAVISYFVLFLMQVWRAIRLIVDTGLHYYGFTRDTALEYFSKYAWDDTDLAKKEVRK